MSFALSALILSASLAQASSPLAPQLPHLVSLFSRQVDGLNPSSIPPACQTICAPTLSAVSTCSDLSCICTNSAAQQIATCADCFASASGSSLQSVQDLIDQYINACNTSGDPVSSIQVSSVVPSSSAGGSTGTSTSGSTDTASTTGSTASSTGTTTAAAAASTTSSSSSAAARSAYVGQGVLACVAAALLAVSVL